MRTSSLFRCALSVCGAAILLAACGWQAPIAPAPFSAATRTAQTGAPFPAKRTEAAFESWHSMIEWVPQPENGCAVATYPELRWRATPCVKPPNDPLGTAHGIPDYVGLHYDWSASVPMSEPMNSAEGFFPQETGVKSEHDNKTLKQNVYSLQMNTNTFNTQDCKNFGSPDPAGCREWQQFIFRQVASPSSHAMIYIEYWLLDFMYPWDGKTKCPPHWINSFGPKKIHLSCFINSTATSTSLQPITQLVNMKEFGFAAIPSRNYDKVELGTPSTLYSAKGNTEFPDLNENWFAAEFNVFGNCCLNRAIFVPTNGSTLVVRTQVANGMITAPTCNGPNEGGTTGETNNLNLTGTPSKWPIRLFPAIIFKETNATTTSPSCAAEPGK
jgi:hypothetical protein